MKIVERLVEVSLLILMRIYQVSSYVKSLNVIEITISQSMY